MLIRKLFRFENAYIVRGCSTQRCARSIHGHSCKAELLLQADALDHGQMVYDFGLLKGDVRELIDASDHAVVLWSDDDGDCLAAMRWHPERWVLIPVSPSAEKFSRLFFRLVDTMLSLTDMRHGEARVQLHSVIVREERLQHGERRAKPPPCRREDMSRRTEPEAGSGGRGGIHAQP